MKDPNTYTQYSEISDVLSGMIKFADDKEDHLLAAKLDNARVTAMQRHEEEIGLV
jgi:hypothetical protein